MMKEDINENKCYMQFKVADSGKLYSYIETSLLKNLLFNQDPTTLNTTLVSWC